LNWMHVETAVARALQKYPDPVVTLEELAAEMDVDESELSRVLERGVAVGVLGTKRIGGVRVWWNRRF
jgi:hypothetical protein